MDFNDWCLSAIDPRDSPPLFNGKKVPSLTVMLYVVCSGDAAKFELACMLLKQAWEVGKENG